MFFVVGMVSHDVQDLLSHVKRTYVGILAARRSNIFQQRSRQQSGSEAQSLAFPTASGVHLLLVFTLLWKDSRSRSSSGDLQSCINGESYVVGLVVVQLFTFLSCPWLCPPELWGSRRSSSACVVEQAGQSHHKSQGAGFRLLVALPRPGSMIYSLNLHRERVPGRTTIWGLINCYIARLLLGRPGGAG